MKLLLTGASSYAGARLYSDLAKKFKIVGTYSSRRLSQAFIRLDVTESREVTGVISAVKPDVIIHAANNASAKWCEAHPAEAHVLNTASAEYIVSAADVVHAKVIYISSMAASDTSSVYGKTKYASEQIIKKAAGGYLILRPSLILGYSANTVNDRPFNRILKNLKKETAAVYDTSWKFQPTYIRHISEVLSEAIENNIQSATVAVAVPELKSRYDVARDILSAFGIAVEPVDNHDTTPVLTDDLSLLEKLYLPRYSYDEMISEVISEVKHPERFILP